MANSNHKVITDWKRLWQLVSGIHYETPETTVLEELTNICQELQDGILQFKTMNASKTNIEKLLQDKKQEKLLPFTMRLQELLDLESMQCWEILCYYLGNEYRGSSSSLTSLISTENNMTQLLDDIWGYYTLERMIVLKIVKNLLIFYKVPIHPYHNEYKQIVNRITLDKLRESFIKQLHYLINETPPQKLTAREFFNYQTKLINWTERNAREIIEVLHIILLLCDHKHFTQSEVKSIFNCFKQHSFGRQQSYLNPSNALHVELLARLAYIEVAVLLKCLDFNEEPTSKELANSIFKSIDKDVTSMCHHQENGPILLAWMMLQIRYTGAIENDEQLLRCRRMGKRAVDLNCFQFMCEMLSNPMFKDDSLVSRIVRKSIYTLLSHLCDYFDGDGSCSKHPYIYELLCELLSWPTLAKEFCNMEEGGVRSLFDTLLERFPIDFIHLSMLSTALTEAGMGSYVKQTLETLPIITDLYDESKYLLKSIGVDEYILKHNVTPFSRIDYTIPEGTSATVLGNDDCCYVHFRVEANYFNVLHHEINCLLTETMHYHGDYENSERVRRVNEGIKYLDVALQNTKSLQAIDEAMVHPTEMCIDLLNKFKAVQKPPVELMANCLNVCTALLPLADAEIFIRVFNLSIMPKLNNESLDDYKIYANGSCLDSALVGFYLVDVEKKRERFKFLHAYIRFLRTHTKLQTNKNYCQVEIPGLVFLLRDVFPHLHVWRFKSQMEKYEIYAEIMGFICDILDEFTTLEKDANVPEDQLLLRNICVYSLLNKDNGIILLRFVALGNAYLQHCMEMESNWMMQQSHGLMLLVRLSMRILMQVLKLKSLVFKSSELSSLEAMIYTQPKQRDTLRIIPVVTRYMSNIFDRWLPILSCRLLKRISLEFNMSLLACLDMESDQIRKTFLQRLPDELESDSIKIAILELVEACIEKQPGVTEAFFNVNYKNEKRILGDAADSQVTDSIVTFMEDYLEAVSKDKRIIEQTLPSKIMNLYHMLWKQNMQLLVNPLTLKSGFWDKICQPLFGEYKSGLKAYTQLLNILAIEIFSTNHKANGDLKNVVSKLFAEQNFEKWTDFVFDLPKTAVVKPYEFNSEEMPEWLCRLQAFKGFLLILLKKQPTFFTIPQPQFKMLADKCLNVLVERSEYVEDLRPLIILSELYLFIILSFKDSCTYSSEEHKKTLKQMNLLLSRVSSCYGDLHVRAKEACLSMTIMFTELLSEELRADSTLSLSFLHSLVNIICTELYNLENCVSTEVHGEKNTQEPNQNSSNTLILCLNLLRTIASLYHDEGFGNWDSHFVANKVFQRLLSCTGAILQLHNKQQLSVELLEVLIVFAKGNRSAEFLHCDVGDYLWLKLLPPKELLQTNYAVVQPQQANWTVHKWWPIYGRGIELVTILFQQHSYHFLKETLQFVGIHEEYLVDSLMLAKQSLEPSAMRLIKSCTTLLGELVPFEKAWRLEHSQSFFNLKLSIKMLLSHAISMFHQPKNLKLLIAGKRSQMDIIRDFENNGLVDEVITAFNDLTEVIIQCVKCLQAFSPNLIDLICEPELHVTKWEPLFEISFGAPKLSEKAIHLTFGTVLSIVGVYTKVLNLQNYGFHEVPLNVLPQACNNAERNETNSNNISKSPQVHNTSQRPFSKSLSVASVTSINCPPNELLSNLDGELCLVALEHILTLAASQSMLALKNPYLPVREKQLVRREISSELLSFHEFVRKKVLVDFREHNKIWHRRKHGQILMQLVDDERDEDNTPSTSGTQRINAQTQRKTSSDLRVNVVRRLHLQQQHHKTPSSSGTFEMSRVISPIAGDTSNIQQREQQQPSTSTPALARQPLRRPGDLSTQKDGSKRVHMAEDVSPNYMEDIQEEEETILFPPEEPKHSSLSYVQFVEEDYLHFMSNLFFVICQND